MSTIIRVVLSLCVLAMPTLAAAQLGSTQYTFSAGTTIRSAELNTMFTYIYANAVLRTGGTLTGTLTTLTLLPTADNVSDIGSAALSYNDGWFDGTLTVAALTVTTMNTYTFNQSVASGASPTFTGTNFTGIPISTGVSGLGTGVATFLATPSSANLASAVTDETGSGALVFATSPTLVTPALGTPSSVTLTNATGLPVSTGISGLGTGVATALAVNIGSAGAPVLFNGAGGTPSSMTGTNITGIPAAGVSSGTFAGSTAAVFGGTLAWGGGSAISSSGAVALLAGATFTGQVSVDTATGDPVLWGAIAASPTYTALSFNNSLASSSAMSGIFGRSAGADSGTLYYAVPVSQSHTWLGNGNVIASLSASGVLTVSDNVIMSATKKLYLDGGSDTYIVESSANVLSTYTGGVNSFGVNSDGPFVIAGKKLFLDSGGDTYIYESSANRIAFVSGGTEMFVVNSGVPINLSKEALGVEATKKLYLDGGGDSYIAETTANVMSFYAGAANPLNLRTTGVYVSNAPMYIDPTQKLYLDGGGDTYIQENGANLIDFYAGGALYLRLQNSGGQFFEAPVVYNATSASAANVVVIYGGQLLRSTSSLRYKTDVQDFNGGLADLLQLQPVSFLSTTEPDGPRHLGFTAEALDAAGFYNVVVYDDQGRPDAIQYDRLTTYLVNAVQELSAEVATLRQAAGLPAVVRPVTPPDATSRAKAIAREQSLKAARDDKSAQRTTRDAADTLTKAEAEKVRLAAAARQAIRTRLTACDADNVIIVAQGGKPLVCDTTDADRAERKAMQTEAAAAQAQAAADAAAKRKEELARCDALNAVIVKQGGKPRGCGGTL